MLHISLLNDTKKIFFEAICCEDSEIAELEKELSYVNDLKYEITFSNIKALPISIIEKLVAIQDNMTIYVTQRTLWLYLISLNFKVQFLTSHLKTNIIKKNIQAICIGGSAGCLEKIIQIINPLPYVDISIFITIHILPTVKSNLVNILQKHTTYKVIEPQDNQKIEPNCIYVAPADYHMIVQDDYIYLSHSSCVNYARPSIDVLFDSVSNTYKQNAIAILTCGYGKDGTLFLKNLKENQTEIILEDPDSCEANHIILNAIESNHYDKIFTIEQIINYINSKLNTCIFEEEELDKFLDDIYEYYGYDFRNYEKKSLLRRINLTKASLGVDSFFELKNLVFNNPPIFEKLLRNFSINVTTFFRNPEVFKTIKEKIIPKIKNKNFIRIWCAGCSSGQEAYSVAILFDKLGLLHKTQIYATDFNLAILMQAKNGLYSLSSYEQYEKNYKKVSTSNDLSNYFDITKNYAVVKEHIKNKILFFDHNLVTDGSINEFDIIFCRNVLIYFDKTLQKRVFNLIYDSMLEDGFLILGESEIPTSKEKFKLFENNTRNKIYFKNNSNKGLL
jgi:chemotaxis protein methyltransferase CheR